MPPGKLATGPPRPNTRERCATTPDGDTSAEDSFFSSIAAMVTGGQGGSTGGSPGACCPLHWQLRSQAPAMNLQAEVR